MNQHIKKLYLAEVSTGPTHVCIGLSTLYHRCVGSTHSVPREVLLAWAGITEDNWFDYLDAKSSFIGGETSKEGFIQWITENL